MARKVKAKEDEQVVLLREILAELRKLNENLEKRQQPAQEAPGEIEDAADVEDDEEDDSEELEYFE